MFKRFLPKEYSFFTYFEDHIAIVVKIAEEFHQLMRDGSDVGIAADKIRILENEADDIHHHCMEALHKTFITPIERVDIFDLVKRQDDIADYINSSVGRLRLYEMKEFRIEAVEISRILVETTKELEKAVIGIRDLKKSHLIKTSCRKVHELENEADDMHAKALGNLFKENDAILVIKWKEIFEKLEKAVDRCESVANVIEQIIIDSA